jgi:hypothetical protein
MTRMSKPILLRSIHYGQPTRREIVWNGALALITLIGWICCASECVLIRFVRVELIVITTPMRFALGVAAVAVGIWLRQLWPSLVGMAHVSVSLIFFSLIVGMNWGPAEARKPILWLSLFYAIGITLPTIMALRHWFKFAYHQPAAFVGRLG